jgi:hypothetical protein
MKERINTFEYNLDLRSLIVRFLNLITKDTSPQENYETVIESFMIIDSNTQYKVVEDMLNITYLSCRVIFLKEGIYIHKPHHCANITF